MATPAERKPRKRPQQERSRATVDAILEATAQVLVGRGSYEAATTNHIAERAGVSIGTLYQYFPSKDALILALLQRRRQARIGAIMQKVGETASWTLADSLRALVPMLVELRSADKALEDLLDAQLSRLGRVEEMHRSARSVAALVEPLLSTRRAEVRPPDLKLASRLVVAMADQLPLAALFDEDHTEEAVGVVVAEVADAIIRYLCIGEGR